MKILVYIIAITIALLILVAYSDVYEKETKQWCKENSVTIISIERCVFNTGPFIVSENCHIYQVKTNRGEYWFRYGLFYSDIEKKTNSGYVKIR